MWDEFKKKIKKLFGDDVEIHENSDLPISEGITKEKKKTKR